MKQGSVASWRPRFDGATAGPRWLGSGVLVEVGQRVCWVAAITRGPDSKPTAAGGPGMMGSCRICGFLEGLSP